MSGATPAQFPRTVGFTISTTAFLWTTTIIASSVLWPIYQTWRLVVLVAFCLVVGSTIAILGAVFRWSSFIVFGSTVGVYLAAGVGIAVPSTASLGFLPTFEGERSLVDGTASAWKQLLTIRLPVGDYQALLVPAFVLVLVSTVVALSVGLRGRWGELGVIPPIFIFITATLFGPQSPVGLSTALGRESVQSTVIISLCLLAATLLWLIWSRWYRHRETLRAGSTPVTRSRTLRIAPPTVAGRDFAGVRTGLSAFLIVAIAGIVAVVATHFLEPTEPRQVLRSTITQPFEPRNYTSPLSSFRAWFQPGEATSTLILVDGLPAGGRIRLATLDTYDGIVFTAGSDRVTSESGSFTRVPTTFDQSQSSGTPISIAVRIAAYSGVWLPTIGKFESIIFGSSDAHTLRESFFYNDTTGTAAVLPGVSRGTTYRLTAVQPRQPITSQISSLRPGRAVVPALAAVPDTLVATLETWVRSASDPGSKLEMMLTQLQSNGYLSHGVDATAPPSRSGHSADRITRLLTDPRMIGDQEQYAVTGAIMARQLGFPSRVVVGFAPTDVSPSGTTTIHGSDISAWVEVDTAQFGWVTIDPTPPRKTLPPEIPIDPANATIPQSPVQPPEVIPPIRDETAQADSVQSPPVVVDPALQLLILSLRISAVSAFFLALMLAPFVLIVLTKTRRRRRRRRAPTDLQKISGAWQEFEDAVRDHGFDPPAAPTRSEVAALVGGSQSVLLAAAADRAVFSPGEPSTGEAEAVWRSVGELRRRLHDGGTRRQRLGALISLHSLGWGLSQFRMPYRSSGSSGSSRSLRRGSKS